ncbi:insulinoma-associated protein 2 [Amia ocellicauda]|uniref:insulinoma-associated protein 2 n=1 Tax=Amia ocellicauda TaxID=2972642 RepID=UPI0034641628
MPRGFLVKRSKRTSLSSYRMRTEDKDIPPNTDQPSQALQVQTIKPVKNICSHALALGDIPKSFQSVSAETEEAKLPESAEKSTVKADLPQTKTGHPEQGSPGRADASYSPIKPVGTELKKNFFERCLSSPVSAESFPISTSVSPIERLLRHHSHFSTSDVKMDTPVHLYSPLPHAMKRALVDSTERKSKPSAKKPKAIRKLNFEDEVTTSPVLGLKIKKESPESKAASLSGHRKPLGEFICQLCKEEYADPFSLAQHKCSRIVRVEYRCPECDKVFSCPANLASHRRWHKPRPASHGEEQRVKKADSEQPSVEGKENASQMNDQHQPPPDSPCRVQQHHALEGLPGQEPADRTLSVEPQVKAVEKRFDQHHPSVDSSRALASSEATDAAAAPYLASPGAGEEVFECRYCRKTFRRQAYLRKHLAAHETARSSSYSQLESGQITFPCQLCGAHFPSAEIRDKHRLWHAVREDLLVGAGKTAGALGRQELLQGEQQIFSCKHCPSTFFSSPGLTRHINKSHPTENRQVLLLQMPVRPGC